MEKSSAKRVSGIKRGKMIFISLLIFGAVFFLKAMSVRNITLVDVYLIGLAAAFITYLGMLWVNSFKVYSKKVFLIILQPALFVFAEVLFILFFFGGEFARVYEVIFFLLFTIVSVASAYIAFLMTNVFVVSIINPIPLENVARTVSYIFTLIMVHFFTFAFLSTELMFPIFVLLISIIYFALFRLHLMHIKSIVHLFQGGMLITVFNTVLLTIGISQLGTHYEVMSLVPVVVMYSCIHLIAEYREAKFSFWEFVKSAIFILLVVGMNIVIV